MLQAAPHGHVLTQVVTFMENTDCWQPGASHRPFFACVWRIGRLARAFCLGLAALVCVLCPGMPNLFAEEGEPLKELPRAVLRHTPPLVAEWDFETNGEAVRPLGFAAHTLGHGYPGDWTVLTDETAPSRPHALGQATPCGDPSCYHLLINETMRVEYLDLSVGILSKRGTPTSAAGLVLGLQDVKNFYAVLVSPASNMVRVYRFDEGIPTLIKAQAVRPKKRTLWHFLRVQRNTIVSKDFFEISFDNQFFLSVSDSTFSTGQIGLMTTGGGAFAFDNLRVVELVTSRPLSRPPAY